jgi:hypothetical protein
MSLRERLLLAQPGPDAASLEGENDADQGDNRTLKMETPGVVYSSQSGVVVSSLWLSA